MEPLFVFETALERLKRGKKLAREGWNGKGQWVCMMEPLSLPAHSSSVEGPKVNERTARFIGEDTPLESGAYFAIWTAQGKWQPGWGPSTSDLLAGDWLEV